MSLVVRPVTAQDEAKWRELWAGYLVFYEFSDIDPTITDRTWERLVGDQDDMFCFVAEFQGNVIGLANCVLHPNTWSKQKVCYLEDLFVDQNVRSKGAGRALIEKIVQHGKAENWYSLYWRTATGNATAQALYEDVSNRLDRFTYEIKLGAVPDNA